MVLLHHFPHLGRPHRVLARLHLLLHLGGSHWLLGGRFIGKRDTGDGDGEHGTNGNDSTGRNHGRPLREIYRSAAYPGFFAARMIWIM
jgi:hypothetical protein